MKQYGFFLFLLLAVAGCDRHHDHDHDHDHDGHGEHEHADEERVTIPAAIARDAGIEVARAGPWQLRPHIALHGRVIVDPEARRSVYARFPGLVTEVPVSQGQRVSKGEVLARIEGDESLRSYTLTAPVAGTVTRRQINPGELAAGNVLFELADLSRQLVRLQVLPGDQSLIAEGQPLRLRTAGGRDWIPGHIQRLDLAPDNEPALLHALVRYEPVQPGWQPGTPVIAEVLVGPEDAQVPLAVPHSALQLMHGASAVFERTGDTYEVRTVRLGRSDGEYVEVLSGLQAGAEIVVTNSYLIKADLEKAGADHDH